MPGKSLLQCQEKNHMHPTDALEILFPRYNDVGTIIKNMFAQ